MITQLDKITPLLQRLSAVGFRLPLVMSGDRHWAIGQISDWLAQQAIEAALWYSDHAPDKAWTLPPQKVNHELGREAKVVVYDLYSGLDLDALASLVGLVTVGGCFILIGPALEHWPEFDDPYGDHLAVVPWGRKDVRNRFLTRMSQHLGASPQVALIRQKGPSKIPVLPESDPWQFRVDDKDCVTADQRRVVDAIAEWTSVSAHKPLVLQADRGRGKSAAMGIALRPWLAQGKTVVITAPRPQCVDQVLAFSKQQIHPEPLNTPQFFAPDRLLQELPAADLLVVDEAAAIAPGLLLRMVNFYPKVLLATTVQGYEGTGRGFDIRFKPHLDQHTPGWQCHRLRQPIRWHQGDWLEHTFNQLLLLDTGTLLPIQGPLQLDHCQLQPLQDEDISAAVQLLVNAHYRTRPNDIRTLLDGANIHSWVAKQNDRVIAVAMVAEEGRLPASLAAAILQGKRRPRGQNLPQSLAVHLHQSSALGARLWRVVRIAVHPQFHHQGVGSWVLSHLKYRAEQASVDLLGSLFSASVPVLGFWHANHYALLRVGYTPEATTGFYSSLVVVGLSALGKSIVSEADTLFRRDFPLALLETHNQLSVEQVVFIVDRLACEELQREQDKSVVKGYIDGSKVYENVAPSLWRWLWVSQASRKPVVSLNFAQQQALVMKVLQKQDWSLLVSHLKLTGIKQARTLVRQAFEALYE